jgi:hypothetical protein
MRTLYLRSYFSSAQFCVLADAYIRRFEQKKGQGAMVMALARTACRWEHPQRVGVSRGC